MRRMAACFVKWVKKLCCEVLQTPAFPVSAIAARRAPQLPILQNAGTGIGPGDN